jgi:hypothetical protein
MPAGTVPTSSQSDGRWKVVYVPTGSNAASAAILNGGTAKDLTYSFTADGFNYGISQAEVEDKRLTLDQDLTRPGRKKETLEVKYVDSTDANSADVVLTEGSTGQLAIRRGTSNATTLTATTDKVDIITYQAGAKRPDAPVENGVDTVSQTLYITAVTQRDVTVIA